MPESFGTYIRRTRIKARKTLKDVAGEVNVTPAYIWDIEKGRRAPPSPDKIERWAATLGLATADLLDRARVARKSVELPLSNGSSEDGNLRNSLSLALAREWEGLEPRKLEELLKVLKEKND